MRHKSKAHEHYILSRALHPNFFRLAQPLYPFSNSIIMNAKSWLSIIRGGTHMTTHLISLTVFALVCLYVGHRQHSRPIRIMGYVALTVAVIGLGFLLFVLLPNM